jgi:polyprenyl-phospho-N-acetylgalactosaminyl synthase
MNGKVFIVVPAYNEAAVIVEVIREIKAAGYEHIVVVDDGSTDGTVDAARKEQVTAQLLSIKKMV